MAIFVKAKKKYILIMIQFNGVFKAALVAKRHKANNKNV